MTAECGTRATMHDLNGFALFGLSAAFGRRTDMGGSAQEVSHDYSQNSKGPSTAFTSSGEQ